jgi:hypothetical protein
VTLVERHPGDLEMSGKKRPGEMTGIATVRPKSGHFPLRIQLSKLGLALSFLQFTVDQSLAIGLPFFSPSWAATP